MQGLPEDVAMGLELEAIDLEHELVEAQAHGRLHEATGLRRELDEVYDELDHVAADAVRPQRPARIAAPRAGDVAA
jgi:hypothetical protein